MALINTKFPELVSSCRQKLNALTVKLHMEVLPAASVAVQVTVVVPDGKVWPEVTSWLFWFLQTILTAPGQLSVAVTVKLTGGLTVAIGQEAAPTPAMLAGQVITGGVLSTTVTVKEQFAPPGSLQLTVVAPTAKQVPDGGMQVTVPQVPLIIVEKGTTAQHCVAPGPVPVEMFAGQVMTHTAKHCENSDVSWKLGVAAVTSVAVAVTNWPAAKPCPMVKVKLMLQSLLGSVTVTEPSGVCPSPNPDGSHAGLAKNSILKV